jgi:hypothetical protein
VIAALLLLIAADPQTDCYAPGERVGIRDPRLRDPACPIPVGLVLTAPIVDVRDGVSLSVYPPCANGEAWEASTLPGVRAYFTARGIEDTDIVIARYACVPDPRVDARVFAIPEP